MGFFDSNSDSTSIVPNVLSNISNMLGVSTSTNTTPIVTAPPGPEAAPAIVPSVGPTQQANQGLAFNNPLNGMGAKPAAPQPQTVFNNPNVQGNPSAAPVQGPAAPQQQAPMPQLGGMPQQAPAPQMAPQQAPAPQAQPVAPQMAAPQMAPQQAPAPQVQPAAPQAAVAPAANYAQQVQQQESGSNPNIGFHNPAISSAYGAYGLTKGAYADVQNSNPYFKDKPITSLSADDQKKALDTLTGLNSDRLTRLGVDPTTENLRLAHFLGAQGAANYMNNGQVSNAAAAANGGDARVRQIADGILGRNGAPTPTGVSSNQQIADEATVGLGPNPGTGITYKDGSTPNHYETLTNGTDEDLWNLSKDITTPPAVAKMAMNKLANNIDLHNKVEQATANIQSAIAEGKPQVITNALSQSARSSNSGNFSDLMAYAFYKMIGADKQAQDSIDKFAPRLTASAAMVGNDHYAIQTDSSGNIIEARDENGQLVNDKTLAQIRANAISGKNIKTSAAMVTDPATGNQWSESTQEGRVGKIWRNEQTGEISQTMPKGATPFGQINPQTKANIALATSAKRMMVNQNVKDRAAGLTPTYSDEDIENISNHISNGGQMPAKLADQMAQGTGGETPAAPATSGTTAPQGTVASRLSPALEDQAQAIYRGEQPMPTGLGAANLTNRALSNRVQEIAKENGKPFDPTAFGKMKKTEEEFNTGKLGTTVKSMNVAIDHLDTLQEAASALHNGNIPLFNKIANMYATNTGETAPGSFDAVKTIVGSEVSKAIAGGATALGDREEIRKELDNAKNPQQLAAVIDKYQHLLAGQVNGLHTQFTSGHGRESEWDTKLTDRTKTVLGGKQGTSTPAPYSDAAKEARYQEFLKKRNAGTQ